jgi:hypothetical protein
MPNAFLFSWIHLNPNAPSLLRKIRSRQSLLLPIAILCIFIVAYVFALSFAYNSDYEELRELIISYLPL